MKAVSPSPLWMEKLLCESALEGHSSPNGTGLVKKEERVFLFVYSELWLINKAIKTHSLKIRDKRGLGNSLLFTKCKLPDQSSCPWACGKHWEARIGWPIQIFKSKLSVLEGVEGCNLFSVLKEDDHQLLIFTHNLENRHELQSAEFKY